eukprot:CAMPEP_0184697394 /NCGR_PEP_ID=MMETSP0313-20130426/4367_1 /TAXON_ID=2792 /ORGANISM="Porphyridium aerugineum, Strain SAG 1380-2" /LENGTH=978 /DNA_ID=CAMNT_0027156181 /DNA_START=118 /DNA_END=3051 /DNA_ORIENTATION=-
MTVHPKNSVDWLLKPLKQVPLESATREVLGGKALKCWELAMNGFPVPEAAVISTLAYDAFTASIPGLQDDMRIGLHGSVDQVSSVVYRRDSSIMKLVSSFGREVLKRKKSIMTNPSLESEIRGDVAARVVVQSIQTRIQSANLSDELMAQIKGFVASFPAGTTFAVRSSGTYEDMAMASFAGQYDTYLNQKSVEDISRSVILCWASMWRNHVLEYRRLLENRRKSPDSAPADLSDMPLPKMSVLLMVQIDSKVSGVMFTRNPVSGASNEAVIEAVYGQGEGLVSGELTPDRYVYNRIQKTEVSRDISELKTHKFQLSNSFTGTDKVDISDSSLWAMPALTQDQILNLIDHGNRLNQYYGHAQDIEWCIDSSDTIYLLQTRHITSAGDAGVGAHMESGSSRPAAFLPPGPGAWAFDNTHFAKPTTKHIAKCYEKVMAPGGVYSFSKSLERVGVGLDGIENRFVNGFMYGQPHLISDPNELMRRGGICYEFWEKKLYLKFLEEFDNEWKPQRIREHEDFLDKFIDTQLDFSLETNEGLVELAKTAYSYAFKCYLHHHDFTGPAVICTGDLVAQVTKWSGCSVLEALELFDNASPESRGVLNYHDPIVKRLHDALREYPQSVEALKMLNEDEDADSLEVLELLIASPNPGVQSAMKDFIRKFGYRLTNGYDLCCFTNMETPEFMLRALLTGLEDDGTKEKQQEAKYHAHVADIRNRVPEELRTQFDTVLDESRKLYRMRDERGLFSDLTGVGLARTLLLKVGKVLETRMVLRSADLLAFASEEEAEALIKGSKDAVSNVELENRLHYYNVCDGSTAPRTLGAPLGPPPAPPSDLPPFVMRSIAAMQACLGHVFTGEDAGSDFDTIRGVAASRGVIQGRACLIRDPSDLCLVEQNDILVTYSTSAAFNSILPLLSGIVADFGGTLSHSAIIARESGIPAVVGCLSAMERIQTGMIIQVNGEKGEIRIIDSKNIKVDPGKVRK